MLATWPNLNACTKSSQIKAASASTAKRSKHKKEKEQKGYINMYTQTTPCVKLPFKSVLHTLWFSHNTHTHARRHPCKHTHPNTLWLCLLTNMYRHTSVRVCCMFPPTYLCKSVFDSIKHTHIRATPTTLCLILFVVGFSHCLSVSVSAAENSTAVPMMPPTITTDTHPFPGPLVCRTRALRMHTICLTRRRRRRWALHVAPLPMSSSSPSSSHAQALTRRCLVCRANSELVVLPLLLLPWCAPKSKLCTPKRQIRRTFTVVLACTHARALERIRNEHVYHPTAAAAAASVAMSSSSRMFVPLCMHTFDMMMMHDIYYRIFERGAYGYLGKVVGASLAAPAKSMLNRIRFGFGALRFVKYFIDTIVEQI